MPRKRGLPALFEPGRPNTVRVYDPATDSDYNQEYWPAGYEPPNPYSPAPSHPPPADSNPPQQEQAASVDDQGNRDECAASPSQSQRPGVFYSSHEAAPLLWTSHDKCEAHFLLQDPGFVKDFKPPSNERPFGFGTLRFVRFQDREELVGWCSTPSCPDKTDLGDVLEGKHYEEVPADEFLDSPTLCTCLRHLVNDLGGELRLKRLLSAHTQQTRPPYSVYHAVSGKQYYVVQLSDSYSSLGLVKRYGNKWLCQTCKRHSAHCNHIKCMRGALGDDGADVEGVPWQSGVDFEAKLKKVFDFEQGQRRLTCISMRPLPQELEDDPVLLSIYQARARGECAIPSVVKPDVATICCPSCGLNNWSEASAPEGAQKCIVFLLASAVEVTFAEASCQTRGCDTILAVDGQEYGILRYSEKYAFAHEVLIAWGEATESHGAPFYTFWRETIQRYKGFTLAQRRHMLHNLQKPFLSACLDWVQLQGIEWEKEFQCSHDSRHIMADALTLGYRLKHAHIVHPWYDERAADTPLVWGSQFASRIFVRDVKLRKLLLEFSCGDDDKALLGEQHQALLDMLAEGAPHQEGLLSPFVTPYVVVDGGRVKALAKYRELVFCLATDSPVAQLLKPAVDGLVQWLLSDAHAMLRKSEQDVFLDSCPVLFQFLKPLLGRPLPSDVQQLLASMRHVAGQAYVCEAQRSFCGDKREPNGHAHAAFLDATGRAADPQAWSHEEAFVRTCTWGGPSQEPWQPSALGGSDVVRALPVFGADCVKGSSERRSCTKHKDQNKSLIPGLMLFWCRECFLCIFFQIMSNAESPKTKFEAIDTRWAQPPADTCYDNNCNFLDYIMNRRPEHYRKLQVAIDHAHFLTHKDCNLAFDSQRYRNYKNSSLPEQKNRVLRRVESSVVSMNQFTFMWYIRYFLYRQNRLQRRKNSNQCITQPPWLSRG